MSSPVGFALTISFYKYFIEGITLTGMKGLEVTAHVKGKNIHKSNCQKCS